ncbi:thioredoxin family protein [Rhodocytophaga rosea]|uniref:Thioredoxin family protein n=1 Tax=Rhodocytophaga rosea TaxID=2704465 RepID=A0A6C0GH61_9BACT|nr:thioredoxin family protein [Rhodocytophaga rosea]QHT67225.1 thioredoxin family protein [Rhodocytophaga rosea]
MKKTTYLIALVFVTIALYSATWVAGGYSIGDKVKDFSLKNVDGKSVSLLGNKEAKGYIIAFTCNTCPMANLYEDRIIALHEKYAPKGYPVLAIQPNDIALSRGDSFEAMQKRAKEKNYSFPYLLDETQEVTRTFGATNTPHMFIVSKEGNDFKLAYIGAIDNNPGDGSQAEKKYVENALEELLSNKPVSQTSAKAIGCGIKWKSS